jgi:hypothetical protein
MRRQRAAKGLERWRQAELLRCAKDLRGRDLIIRHISDAVTAGTISDDGALLCLAGEYHGYTELEYRFQCLLRNKNTLELWRESRRTA